MLDHVLESAFVAVLQGNPLLTGTCFFTSHNSDEHALPAVTLSSRSEPLAGSCEVFRSELSVMVESDAHDTTPEQHAALVEKVRTRLANKAAVGAAINAEDGIHLYGYAFTSSSLDVDGSRFSTTLTLRAGYGIP